MDKHNCDNVNCNHNNTKGLCYLFNPENCKYRQLQKENAELKKACDETQELLDKQIEATYKLDKENTELRDNYEQYKAVAEPEIKSLKEENAELKKMYHETDEDNNKLRENIPLLTEAKEIIKKLQFLYLSPVVTKDDVKRQDEILAEVKQFLKDSKVEKC